MKYRVERNYCNCHPETCICNPWNVVSPEGDKMSTHYNKDDADKLVKALNKD